MKVWIVCEHPEGWGIPNNIVDMMHGTFLTYEEAVRCLQSYINIFNMTERLSLFLNGSVATDDDGNRFYEIVENSVSLFFKR